MINCVSTNIAPAQFRAFCRHQSVVRDLHAMPPPAAYDDFTRGIRCFRPRGSMARAGAGGPAALWHTSHQSSLLRNVETHICVSHRRLGKKTCTRIRRAMACLYIPRTMQSSRHDVETRLIASLLPDTSSSLVFALAFSLYLFHEDRMRLGKAATGASSPACLCPRLSLYLFDKNRQAAAHPARHDRCHLWNTCCTMSGGTCSTAHRR